VPTTLTVFVGQVSNVRQRSRGVTTRRVRQDHGFRATNLSTPTTAPRGVGKRSGRNEETPLSRTRKHHSTYQSWRRGLDAHNCYQRPPARGLSEHSECGGGNDPTAFKLVQMTLAMRHSLRELRSCSTCPENAHETTKAVRPLSGQGPDGPHRTIRAKHGWRNKELDFHARLKKRTFLHRRPSPGDSGECRPLWLICLAACQSVAQCQE